MLATVRDAKGQGPTGLYVRIRNNLAQYWDFAQYLWNDVESSATKSYLVEYQDSDPYASRYQIDLVLPASLGDVVVEYVRAVDGLVLAEETPQLSNVSDKLTKVLGLLYDNSILTETLYDQAGKLLQAKVKCYDSAANAVAAGDVGLITAFAVHSEYDGAGRLTLFRITE